METKIKTLGDLRAANFHVELDWVRLPDGGSRLRLAVRHPSAVAVIPLIEPGRALVVHQWRYAVGRDTIEFPAGKIDPGESPHQTAFRELDEETGYRPGRLTPLITLAPALGYSDELIHVFVADDLKPWGQASADAEISKVESVLLTDLRDMIVDGRIIDGTTIAALAAWQWAGGTM
jgi:ADP-ribose pyrophosphatase